MAARRPRSCENSCDLELPQPLRRNTPNNKRSEKNRSEEGCETQGQENVAFNKAYDHDRDPKHGESKPQVNRENFLPWMAKQKEPIPFRENGSPSYPSCQHHHPNHHENQQERVG